METERLAVLYNGRRVATLARDSAGGLGLTYDSAVMTSALGLPLISASLPVREPPYGTSEVLPYFEGLLPEGSVRDRLAVRFRLAPDDTFGLLREIGRDCAGALSIIPERQTDASAIETGGDIEWLDDEELANRVDELAIAPLAVEPDQDIRISLAGVQSKMAVVLGPDGRIGLPRGTSASTHVLKPGSTERRRRKLAYPGLVANEGFCMTLASLSGLDVPRLQLRSIDDEPALLIARYDREVVDEKIARVHQEDFCQALGLPPRRKYEAEQGPGVHDLVQLLRRYSATVNEDLDALVDRVAFNYLIGNADAHAKNFSILYARTGTRLAPAYDLLCTWIYDRGSIGMAMKIGGVADAHLLQPTHWVKMLEALDLSERRYRERLANLGTRVVDTLTEARQFVRDNAADDDHLDRVEALIRDRAKILNGISETPSAPRNPPTRTINLEPQKTSN